MFEEFHPMTTQSLSAAWPGRDEESLVWLASYPRSGNTFARILLANYLSLDDDGFKLNDLSHFIPADTSPHIWENAPAPPPADASWEAVWRARPAVFSNYRKIMGPQRALPGIKTHTVNGVAFGSKGFDFRENDRAIYVVRHPLDVLISFADFNNTNFDTAINMMIHQGFSLRNDKSGGVEVRGSWPEHVRGWMSVESCPLLLVRYEELCKATAATLGFILEFLHIPVIEERVQRAVAASGFDRLRQQEAANNFVELPDDTASGRFFREGKTLQWLRQLSAKQAYRLADACEKVMVPLGYIHPRQVLFDGSNALSPVTLGAQNLNPDSTSSL